MKNNVPLPVELGMRLIGFISIIFISMFIDKFSFGMIDPQNSLMSGLGITLFVGSNIIAFFVGLRLIRPIFDLVIEETTPITEDSVKLMEKYNNYKTKSIRSFASWWGYKLVEAELKKRKLLK
jgi:hypothetical protein